MRGERKKKSLLGKPTPFQFKKGDEFGEFCSRLAGRGKKASERRIALEKGSDATGADFLPTRIREKRGRKIFKKPRDEKEKKQSPGRQWLPPNAIKGRGGAGKWGIISE